MKAFAINDKHQVINSAHQLEIWIPDKFFDDDDGMQIASIEGDYIETLGILIIRVRETDDAEWSWFNFAYGAYIKLINSSSRKEVDVYAGSRGGTKENYTVLEYARGDVVMPTNSIVQNDVAYTDTINAIIAGSMPAGIPYRQYLETASSAAEANEKDIGVPHVLLEAVVATLCRNKNAERPFRMVYDGENDLNYRVVGVKRLAKIVSSFGITFEDIGGSLPYAIQRSIVDKPEPVIPIEQSL
jgi:hypothetical protein